MYILMMVDGNDWQNLHLDLHVDQWKFDIRFSLSIVILIVNLQAISSQR